MRARSHDLAEELKQVIRVAGRDPEALHGKLPVLSGLHRVTSAGDLDEAARVHLILHRLIPEYIDRLPTGRDRRAIRELLTWEDGDGELQSLTTRYHKAAANSWSTRRATSVAARSRACCSNGAREDLVCDLLALEANRPQILGSRSRPSWRTSSRRRSRSCPTRRGPAATSACSPSCASGAKCFVAVEYGELWHRMEGRFAAAGAA